ncbi:hypothetical protein [Niabella drilacis]|uniref:Uncharacterized protein n=1 Tax=Niabella drilacis (strain DSM 25811 / CCM 8410 / CCUG 62505 / LMG 26954 / E90) TaxID=1285928 RepID=A0A1G6N4L2_NIADE|nr:hypothetical protein [Niabella drilacis]SDC62394.1 hypothetical protein SAMN04487894_103139 [Niabella drilacis]
MHFVKKYSNLIIILLLILVLILLLIIFTDIHVAKINRAIKQTSVITKVKIPFSNFKTFKQ